MALFMMKIDDSLSDLPILEAFSHRTEPFAEIYPFLVDMAKHIVCAVFADSFGGFVSSQFFCRRVPEKDSPGRVYQICTL